MSVPPTRHTSSVAEGSNETTLIAPVEPRQLAIQRLTRYRIYTAYIRCTRPLQVEFKAHQQRDCLGLRKDSVKLPQIQQHSELKQSRSTHGS